MKMAESNKMKEMPVNKLMMKMGIPMIWHCRQFTTLWTAPLLEI